MRTLIGTGKGASVLNLVEAGKLPADLKAEATIALNSVADRSIRDRAAKLLPLPKTAGGRPLPPFYDLVRSEGDASRGRQVFFRDGAGESSATALQACGSCHRVQGVGQWVGPDLSTIGTKYGKDELLRSILTPSSAIGYNYRGVTIATKDGRVLTGLPVEESSARLVLKTAGGERVALRPEEIEEKRFSEVSLMPEGLAESMGERDLIDLLAFMATLKQPVSIVGRFTAAGPIAEKKDMLAIDPTRPDATASSLKGAGGEEAAWRRVEANAEGVIETATLPSGDATPDRFVYLHTPVTSLSDQDARLVLDTKAPVRAWLGGQELVLPDVANDGPRTLALKLAKGTTELVLRVPAGAALVTTFVADRPVEFSPIEANASASR